MNAAKAKGFSLGMIGVFFIIAAIFFYFNRATVTTASVEFAAGNEAQTISAVASGVVTQPQVGINSTDESVGTVNNSAEQILWQATKEQLAELDKWKESRGWYDTSNDTKDDYKSYSKDTLKNLADKGDLKALHLLNKGTPVPEKQALLTKAAVYGSTYALVILKDVGIPNRSEMSQMSEAERKEIVMNAAVYPAVAKLRGELEYSRESDFVALEKTYSVRLNEADRQAIAEKAKAFYADLESQREALGLGKFDSTLPPIAQAYYRSRGLLK